MACACPVMSDSATMWTVAHQAPLSLGFPRQGYWSGFPFASPVDLPDPQIEPTSPTLASRFLPPSPYHSVARLWPSLGDPMNCSMLGLPIHHQLPEFTQTHVHQVGDAIQPSDPLSSHFPPATNSSHNTCFSGPSQRQALLEGHSHSFSCLPCAAAATGEGNGTPLQILWMLFTYFILGCLFPLG